MARTIDEQGNWVEVPDPAAPAPAPPPTGRFVTLIDDTGTPRTIDESEYGPALQAGWREETPEENAARVEAERYGGFGEQVEGTLEEVARVGSFGLSDPIITGALEVAKGREFADAERSRMLARARQLGTAGKVAGTVGGIALSGGLGLGKAGLAAEGLVARGITGAGLGGAGVGRAALGTGARLMAGGAVEGGLYGAGMSLSEAALEPGGNYDNLASKLLAGARTGAGFGAGAGAFLGAGTGAFGALSRKGLNYLTGPGGVKRLLEKEADAAALRAVGRPTRAEVGAAGGEGGMLTLAGEARQHVLDDGTRVFTKGAHQDTIAKNIARGREEVGAKLGSLRREVSDAIESTDVSLRPKLDEFFRGLDEAAGKNAAAEAIPTWTEFLKGRMGPAMKEHGGHAAALRVLAAEYKALKTGAQTAGRAITPSQLAKLREAAAEFEPLRELWKRGEATLENVTQYRIDVANQIRPPRTKGAGIAVARANVDELDAANRMLEGAIAESLEGGLAKLMPGRVVEYGPLKLRYKALATMDDLAQKSAASELTRNRASPFETLFGLGGAVAGIASGSFLPVAGGLAVAAGRRLWSTRGESTLAVLAAQLAKYDGRINSSLTKFFSSTVPRKALGVGAREDVRAASSRTRDALRVRENEALADAYRKRLQEIQGFDPNNMRDVGAIAKEAPGTATGIVARQARAREFLLSKAPRELLGDDPLQAHLRKPVPSRPELEKFARYLRTVEDPLSALDDLNEGRLFREQVEALRVVDPGVYEDLQRAAMEKVTDSTERLPYLKRVQIGILLGIPSDRSLAPDRIAMSQQLYVAPPAPAPMPTGGSGGGGNKIARSMATPSQANEAGTVEF